MPCKAPIAISSGGKAAAYSLWILVGVPRIALSLFIAILVMVAPFVVNVGSIMFISASAMLLRGSNLPNVDEFPPVFQALLDDENKSLVFGIAIFFTVSIFRDFLYSFHESILLSFLRLRLSPWL